MLALANKKNAKEKKLSPSLKAPTPSPSQDPVPWKEIEKTDLLIPTPSSTPLPPSPSTVSLKDKTKEVEHSPEALTQPSTTTKILQVPGSLVAPSPSTEIAVVQSEK